MGAGAFWRSSVTLPPVGPAAVSGRVRTNHYNLRILNRKVSPSNQLAGNLDLGGSFVSAYGMGAGCYYGGCPDWTFFNYPLSYALQDGISESPEKANRLPCLLKYLECAQNPQRPSTNTTP